MLRPLEYFQKMTEEVIFERYQDILKKDQTEAFAAGFSDQNKEMFYRLKFRALNINNQIQS
jgi:hypothetical protein